ncbi:MAG: hypothetical protein IT324_07580 [Anaerolineae bacterium]|nr:hypothetical protein [Anaerolineae bacterium]
MNNKLKQAALVLTTVVVMGGAGLSAANAQGPDGGPGLGDGPRMATLCSVTHYTDVAAKALGMDSLTLRKALAGGQTLTQIASSKQVSIQTVQDAIKAARDADLQQAVKDGLLTQEAYDQIKARQNQAVPPANDPKGNQPKDNPPDRIGGGGDISAYIQVNLLDVAAKSLSMSCVDVAKAVQDGQSLAQIATSKSIQPQAVIDALVTAEKTALAQDVTDGIITQAQADGRLTNLTARLTAYVHGTQPQGQRGDGQGQGGRGNNLPGNPPQGGRNPQQGGPGNPPPGGSQPQAPGSAQ